MDAKIKGTVMPVLEVTLNPGEIVTAEGGELSWMSESIQMRTSTRVAGASGVFGGLKRAVGGGNQALALETVGQRNAELAGEMVVARARAAQRGTAP